MAKCLCVANINSCPSLEPYIVCRLIPLDKNPGVCPIGIGQVLRRIIDEAVISIIKLGTLESARSLQLYAGLPSGCDADVHALTEIYEKAILLFDTSNAFNALNRRALLDNIRYIMSTNDNVHT